MSFSRAAASRSRPISVCCSSSCFCGMKSVWRTCSLVCRDQGTTVSTLCGKAKEDWESSTSVMWTSDKLGWRLAGSSIAFPLFRRGRSNGWSLRDVLSWWIHVRSARLFWGGVKFWKWERSSSIDSKDLNESTNAVVILGAVIYALNCRDWWMNLRDQTRANTQFMWKPKRKKSWRKRGFYYNS